jgi:hypothetical protein
LYTRRNDGRARDGHGVQPYYLLLLKKNHLTDLEIAIFTDIDILKTPVHPRIPGDWNDTPLPSLPASKTKIPRFAVHTEWLADHEDQDLPSRIQEKETEVDDDDDADDEKDL